MHDHLVTLTGDQNIHEPTTTKAQVVCGKQVKGIISNILQITICTKVY
jgi:hypothetical protein